jgi:hypothetical protein
LPSPGTGHVVVVSLKARNIHDAEAAIPGSEAARSRCSARQGRAPGSRLGVTGRAALTHDLSRFDAETRRRRNCERCSRRSSFLVIAFGSLAATALPLIVGVASTTLTLGVIWCLHGLLRDLGRGPQRGEHDRPRARDRLQPLLIHSYRQEVRGETSAMAIARSLEATGPSSSTAA